MTNHAELTSERWRQFSLDQQILMIGNEMSRASQQMSREDLERRQASYERVLRLVDLTIEVQKSRGLRRELLLWREVIAGLYLSGEADADTHRIAFKLLLQLTPVAAQQVQYLDL